MRALTMWIGPVLLLSSLASAAEVTDGPPMFRGDVHVTYGGAFEQVGLEERGDTWGIRNTTRHDLDLALEGSPYRGVILRVGLPISVQQRIAYPAAREMLYEPLTGEGSYVNGQPIEVSDIVSGGLKGAWFGLGFVPFSERYARTLPFTARLDVAVRTGARRQTMYGSGRGGAPGGPALLFSGAFSKRHGLADAYFKVGYQLELPADVDEVVDNDGNVWATELRVRDTSRLDATIGVELIAKENVETGLRVAIDLHGGVGYRSWADRASGFWLPSVLETSRGVTVTESEYVLVEAGAGLDVHMNRWLGLRFGASGQYFTPHTVESAYAVRTDGGSWAMAWHLGLVGRVRTRKDDLADG